MEWDTSGDPIELVRGTSFSLHCGQDTHRSSGHSLNQLQSDGGSLWGEASSCSLELSDCIARYCVDQSDESSHQCISQSDDNLLHCMNQSSESLLQYTDKSYNSSDYSIQQVSQHRIDHPDNTSQHSTDESDANSENSVNQLEDSLQSDDNEYDNVLAWDAYSPDLYVYADDIPYTHLEWSRALSTSLNIPPIDDPRPEGPGIGPTADGYISASRSVESFLSCQTFWSVEEEDYREDIPPEPIHTSISVDSLLSCQTFWSVEDEDRMEDIPPEPIHTRTSVDSLLSCQTFWSVEAEDRMEDMSPEPIHTHTFPELTTWTRQVLRRLSLKSWTRKLVNRASGNHAGDENASAGGDTTICDQRNTVDLNKKLSPSLESTKQYAELPVVDHNPKMIFENYKSTHNKRISYKKLLETEPMMLNDPCLCIHESVNTPCQLDSRAANDVNLLSNNHYAHENVLPYATNPALLDNHKHASWLYDDTYYAHASTEPMTVSWRMGTLEQSLLFGEPDKTISNCNEEYLNCFSERSGDITECAYVTDSCCHDDETLGDIANCLLDCRHALKYYSITHLDVLDANN